MEDAVVCCAQLDDRQQQSQPSAKEQQLQPLRGGEGDALSSSSAPSQPQHLLSSALFAVFDGHGGSEVSRHVADHLLDHVVPCLRDAESAGAALKQALLQLEEDLRRNSPKDRWNLVGCTAAVALLSRSSVTVASVGDSRVFKCRNGACVPLTHDHKPESPRERRRIEAAGGIVAKHGPCYRVDLCLNMSRALGDFQFKDPGLPPDQQKISPTPDVMTCEIDDNDEFLVVACDGLFELMTWDTVCDYVHQRIRTTPLSQIAEGLLDACCSTNMFATGGRGTDNESVIIVKLPGASGAPGGSKSSEGSFSTGSFYDAYGDK